MGPADVFVMTSWLTRSGRACLAIWTAACVLVGQGIGLGARSHLASNTTISLLAASLTLCVALLVVVLRNPHMMLRSSVGDEPATTDELTGLSNRPSFYGHVAAALDGQTEPAAALILIDLDRFKEVNDSLGHGTGDQLLQQVGARIDEVLRDGDIVARLGGDEFAIFMAGVPDEHTATRIAGKIRDALDEPFQTDTMLLDVEASIGIAVAPTHGTDVHRLMQRADVAMYAAKRAKAGVRVYDEADDPHSADRLAMTADLRRAVENDEFVLHFQPKERVIDGRIEGVEALLRWQHPERGMVSPAVFIPIAEDNGLMRPITLWVVDAALHQARLWRTMGIALTISVNISMQNLHDAKLTDDIAALLHKWDADADWLRLEVTESAMMEGAESALLRLDGLADMGLELSVDDYGTGYSSLAYLKRMPLSELKIDRSFVQNITADQTDALIVGSTIELGHSLGLRVVAEGVEREEDLIGLQMLGCDVVQGFYLGHPMPADRLVAWLEETGRPYEQAAPIEGQDHHVAERID